MLGLKTNQKRYDIGLLLCRAFTPKDIVAIAFKPFVDFLRIGQNLWICTWCQGLQDFAGGAVLTWGGG